MQRFPPFCPFISLVGSPRHPPLPARADRSATCGSSGSPVRSALRAAGAAGWSSAGRAPGHPRRAAGCGADEVWQHRALSSAPAELRKFKKGTAAPRFFPASSHTPPPARANGSSLRVTVSPAKSDGPPASDRDTCLPGDWNSQAWSPFGCQAWVSIISSKFLRARHLLEK